jgi:hypothetical protein
VTEQTEQMDLVYAGSLLTIIASGGESARCKNKLVKFALFI